MGRSEDAEKTTSGFSPKVPVSCVWAIKTTAAARLFRVEGSGAIIFS